jgi:protein-L-isoaspartate(D-aspartate) O-methyltransferase
MSRSRLLKALGLAALAFCLTAAAALDPYAAPRHKMIEDIRQRGITERALLAAMEAVPRHLFVPAARRGEAYADKAVPLDGRRSIYEPYVVALMTRLLKLQPDDRVLEIGTGSGYHTAILARLAREVYTIEINSQVAASAEKRLASLGYRNITVHVGDGYKGWIGDDSKGGWHDRIEFDAIVLSAAPPQVPKPLLDQLKTGGRMVVPVGASFQDLMVITKRQDGSLEKKTIAPVRVARMEGQAQGGR